MLSRVSSIGSVARRNAVSLCLRQLSSELTPEQIESAIIESEKAKKREQGSAIPLTIKSALPPHPVYEPANRAEIAVLSYQPEEQRKRTVVIGPRPRSTMQSGRRTPRQWQITWKAQERWSNPLMGWTSTADPMSNMRLFFDTSEDAMRFAEKQGWTFEVMEPYAPEDKWGEMQYAHNFLPVSTENALKRQGLGNKIFENPGLGKSNWFMPLKYHGDGIVKQHGPKSDGNK